MVDMKECTKPHPMLHSLTGLGLGLVVAGLVTSLAGQTGIVLGIILIVASIAGHYMIK